MRLNVLVSFFTMIVLTACSTSSKSQPEPQTSAPTNSDRSNDVKKPPTQPVESHSGTSTKLDCASKSDKRYLELRQKDKGCELAYNKNGQEAIVATAKTGDTHCRKTLDKIKERLVGSGFSCEEK